MFCLFYKQKKQSKKKETNRKQTRCAILQFWGSRTSSPSVSTWNPTPPRLRASSHPPAQHPRLETSTSGRLVPFFSGPQTWLRLLLLVSQKKREKKHQPVRLFGFEGTSFCRQPAMFVPPTPTHPTTTFWTWDFGHGKKQCGARGEDVGSFPFGFP